MTTPKPTREEFDNAIGYEYWKSDRRPEIQEIIEKVRADERERCAQTLAIRLQQDGMAEHLEKVRAEERNRLAANFAAKAKALRDGDPMRDFYYGTVAEEIRGMGK